MIEVLSVFPKIGFNVVNKFQIEIIRQFVSG